MTSVDTSLNGEDYEKESVEFDNSSAKLQAKAWLSSKTPTTTKLNNIWGCLLDNMHNTATDSVLEDIGIDRFVVQSATINGFAESVVNAWFPYYRKGISITNFVQDFIKKSEVNSTLQKWMDRQKEIEKNASKTRDEARKAIETSPTMPLNTNDIVNEQNIATPPKIRKPNKELQLIMFDRTIKDGEYIKANIVVSGTNITVESGGKISIGKIDGGATLRLEEGAIAHIDEITQIYSNKPITVYLKDKTSFSCPANTDEKRLINYKFI